MEHAQRPILALVLRLAGVVLMSTLFMLVKFTGESGIALPELMFWRQAVPVAVLAGWLAVTGRLGTLRTGRLGSHASRAVTGTLGMLCGFAASFLLPLAEATTLGFTTPLFAVVMSALFLREHVGPWRWTAVALGFAGVIVIAQPGHQPISTLGAAAGLCAGLVVAVVSFQIRDLSRSESPTSIVFYFSLFGSLLAAPFLPFYTGAHSAWQWLLLLGVGLSGTLGQLLFTAALRYGSVATVIVMDYSALAWTMLYGWLIWDHVPPLATWLGAPAIIAAGLVIAWRERRLAKEPSLPSALDAD